MRNKRGGGMGQRGRWGGEQGGGREGETESLG